MTDTPAPPLRARSAPGRHSRPAAPGRSRLAAVVSLLARLGLAAVWLISGTVKALDPSQTYLAVVAYQVLPPPVTPAVATTLPLLEIALGLLLLAGLATRLVAAMSAGLLVVLVAAVAQAAVRGLAIDCGCFGGGGAVAADQTRYGQEILRDLGFLALAGLLAVRPAAPWTLDGLLRRGEDA